MNDRAVRFLSSTLFIAMAVALVLIFTAAAGMAQEDDLDTPVTCLALGCTDPVPPEDSCNIGVACDPRWDEGGEWWTPEDELGCDGKYANAAFCAGPSEDPSDGPDGATPLLGSTSTPPTSTEPHSASEGSELPRTGTGTALLALLGACMMAAGAALLRKVAPMRV